MTVRMCLDLYYFGGGKITKELDYFGENYEEIAQKCDRDQSALLEYMTNKDEKGSCAFCFQGFIFIKAGLIAAHLYEPEY